MQLNELNSQLVFTDTFMIGDLSNQLTDRCNNSLTEQQVTCSLTLIVDYDDSI